MGILPSFSYVSTIVWLHHLNITEVLGEKSRWNLHKNAACCFEHFLKATPRKTPSVQSPTTYLTNYPSKADKTCCTLLRSGDELISNVFLWTSSHGTHQGCLTSKDLHSSALCRH